jgi:hypothetical protein
MEGNHMPNIMQQPDDGGGVLKLYSEQEARRQVRAGINKWLAVRDEIDTTWLGPKRFFTAAALNKFIRRQTRKGKAKGAKGEREARP